VERSSNPCLHGRDRREGEWREGEPPEGERTGVCPDGGYVCVYRDGTGRTAGAIRRHGRAAPECSGARSPIERPDLAATIKQGGTPYQSADRVCGGQWTDGETGVRIQPVTEKVTDTPGLLQAVVLRSRHREGLLHRGRDGQPKRMLASAVVDHRKGPAACCPRSLA